MSDNINDVFSHYKKIASGVIKDDSVGNIEQLNNPLITIVSNVEGLKTNRDALNRVILDFTNTDFNIDEENSFEEIVIVVNIDK